MLADSGEDLVFGAPGDGRVVALVDGGDDEVVFFGDLHDFVDFVRQEVGDAQALEDALFVEGVEAAEGFFPGDPLVGRVDVVDVELRMGLVKEVSAVGVMEDKYALSLNFLQALLSISDDDVFAARLGAERPWGLGVDGEARSSSGSAQQFFVVAVDFGCVDSIKAKLFGEVEEVNCFLKRAIEEGRGGAQDEFHSVVCDHCGIEVRVY